VRKFFIIFSGYVPLFHVKHFFENHFSLAANFYRNKSLNYL